jgi:type IV pilus assembly protein PilC
MASDSRQFAYVAVTQDGKRSKGRLEADSHALAVQQIQSMNLVPLQVTQLGNSAFSREVKLRNKKFRMDVSALAAFARQLNMLLTAGLSVPRALNVLAADSEKGPLREMLTDLADRVTAGAPLSRALEEHPDAIPETFRAYVAAGEQTGDMERATERLAHTLERQRSLRLKIKSVTTYPKLVAISIAVLVVGIIMFLVPRYAEIYDGLGQKLPAPTRALLTLSRSFSPFHIGFGMGDSGLPSIQLIAPGHSLLTAPVNWLSPVLWLVLGWYGWKTFRRRTAENLPIAARIERIKWRTPLVGVLSRTQVMYQWSSTMAGALTSGLSTFTALELAGRTSGSAYLRMISAELQASVRAGRSLAQQLGDYPDLFSSQLRAMAATGEEAGEPALMFSNIATSLEDDIDAIVATLGARLEVTLMLVMGVVVGGLMMVLYLPIMGLSNAISESVGQ